MSTASHKSRLWSHTYLSVCASLQPFRFEGNNRSKLAEYGLSELKQSVDTMIVIPNQNLFNMSTERTSLMDAFRCVWCLCRRFGIV